MRGRDITHQRRPGRTWRTSDEVGLKAIRGLGPLPGRALLGKPLGKTSDDCQSMVGDSSMAPRLIPIRGDSTGPLLCPPPLEVGHVYTLDLSANRKQKTLPTQPGTYRFMVPWSPYTASDPPCDQSRETPASEEFRPFVTASSVPITIRVLGKQ